MAKTKLNKEKKNCHLYLFMLFDRTLKRRMNKKTRKQIWKEKKNGSHGIDIGKIMYFDGKIIKALSALFYVSPKALYQTYALKMKTKQKKCFGFIQHP